MAASMDSEEKSIAVSLLSIVPVFGLLILNYLYFGLEVPVEPFVYILYGILTVIVGIGVTVFFGEEVSYRWVIDAGLGRWLIIAAVFTLKGIVENLSSFDVAGSFSQIITLQFLFEIPAMIGGYLIGYELYRRVVQ